MPLGRTGGPLAGTATASCGGVISESNTRLTCSSNDGEWLRCFFHTFFRLSSYCLRTSARCSSCAWRPSADELDNEELDDDDDDEEDEEDDDDVDTDAWARRSFCAMRCRFLLTSRTSSVFSFSK